MKKCSKINNYIKLEKLIMNVLYFELQNNNFLSLL